MCNSQHHDIEDPVSRILQHHGGMIFFSDPCVLRRRHDVENLNSVGHGMSCACVHGCHVGRYKPPWHHWIHGRCAYRLKEVIYI